MTGVWGQLLPLLLAGGFVGALVALLTFLNTRRETKTKTGAEAFEVYGKWVTGVITQAANLDSEHVAALAKASRVRSLLIDLVQTLLSALRAKGATQEELEVHQDLLDEYRAM